MARFRKKPVEIEAEQFTGTNALTCKGVCMCPEVTGFADGEAAPHVHTAQAGQVVKLEAGDWIVAEPKAPGRFYPVKPDVMAVTYDLISL